MATIMTPEALLKIAASQEGGFETPHLNDSLYLHFKGWNKIENLEPYSELKALWLESNGLQKLENLDALKKLRCLYVQQNLLTKIENIQPLISLRILDISQNRLTKLDNIGSLPCLETLNASKNLLENHESLKELVLCKCLFTIDLSNNVLDGDEEVLDAIASAPSLVSFNLTGNPIMKTPQLRKKMICKMPKLTYLDRPVFEAERFAAEAWGKGGRDAEINARSEYQKMQKEKAHQETADFQEWKDRKIKEHLEKHGGNTETPSLSSSVTTTTDIEDGNNEDKTEEEVNVTKLAHKFWSAQATDDGEATSMASTLPIEAASFRAPSYRPDPLDESLAKIKVKDPPAIKPCDVSSRIHEKESESIPIPPPLMEDSSLPKPPVPPPMKKTDQGTDFDELD